MSDEDQGTEDDVRKLSERKATAIAESSAITQALSEAQSKLSDIQGIAAQAIVSRTAIDDHQGVVASKSAHIQDAQVHADKVRSDLDHALTAASLQVTQAEGFKTAAQTSADSAAAKLADVRAVKSTVDTDAAVVVLAREACIASATTTKSLADKAETIEERIAKYETRLGELQEECTRQLETIEDLLPGATGVALAHAFDQRRQTFLKPRVRWQAIFVGSVIALVGLAGTGLVDAWRAAVPLTYDELARLWLLRLPIAGALVWLALHASRESALAKRLEEDYGYKSAIASSFVGFNKQMTAIGASAATNSPLETLCSDTLRTFATPPGRIYDKHGLVTTPAKELAAVGKDAIDAVAARR